MTGIYSDKDKAEEVMHRIQSIVNLAMNGHISAFHALAEILAVIRHFKGEK